MTPDQIYNAAFTLSKKVPGDTIGIQYLLDISGCNMSSIGFDINKVNAKLHDLNKNISVRKIKKSNALEVVPFPSGKKSKEEGLSSILNSLKKDPPVNGNSTDHKGCKTGEEAAGSFIARFLYNHKGNSCSVNMVHNQLINNRYSDFNFKHSIKVANRILKNDYNSQLELINGYLVVKKIETKEIRNRNVSSYKMIEPLVQINGKQKDFNTFRLYVYDSITNTKCQKGDKHNPENITLVVNNSLNQQVKINVFHCKNCDLYYTITEAVKNHFPALNYPFVQMHCENVKEFNLHQESMLKIYGYNVQKNGLSDYQRKNLLVSLLYYNVLSKHQIVSIIQYNIHLHKTLTTFTDAIKKWQDDLEFVQNYEISKQNTLNVENVDVVYKNKLIK